MKIVINEMERVYTFPPI